MPSVYERFGVKFLYPENWKIVEEEDGDEWPKSVTVQSPHGAFLSLYVYDGALNVRELVREAVGAMEQEYQDLESEQVLHPTDGAEYGFDIDFYCLDLIVTAQVRGVQLAGKTLVWQCQAENRDFDQNAIVFKAITATMLGKVPIPGDSP